MFNELNKIIEEKNKEYQNLNEQVQEAEKSLNEEDIKQAKFNRWQFIHDYATELSTQVLHNIERLQRQDLPAFDLVPYTVWEKVPLKTKVIIEAINKLN